MLADSCTALLTAMVSATIYVRPAAGQSEIYMENGYVVQNPDLLYNDDRKLKLEDLKVRGKMYHGTKACYWKNIVETSLKPAGDGRSNRLMNHLAVYPSGDARNLAGAREDSEVVIEYDAAGFLEYIKDKPTTHGIYFNHNNSIVTAEPIPGDFAMRVLKKNSLQLVEKSKIQQGCQ